MMSNKGFLGLIMIAVSFILFPIVMEGANIILADPQVAAYTGLETIVAIAPTLVFVGMLIGGGVLSYMGFSGSRKR